MFYYFTILAGFSEETLLTVAKSFTAQHYSKGQAIVEQNEVSDSFYIIEYGVVSIAVRS